MKSKFNWITFLKRAIKKKPINRDCDLAKRKSGWWTTCACGNLCKKLPRFSDGEPQDGQLSKMGMSFYRAICLHDWDLALSILYRIEKRTAKLLKEKK